MTSTTALRLRDYQVECVETLMKDLAEPHPQGQRWHLATVLPTGSGKTVIFTAMSDAWHAAGHAADGPVMIVVHRDELVDQTIKKLHDGAPELVPGVIKAARHEIEGRDVLVVSVQSMNAARRERTPRPSLLIIDECHHASATTYRKLIEWADAPVLGFTATLSRADGKALGRAAGGVFDKISYQKSILWMIRNGYLADAIGQRVVVDDLDLTGLRKVRGDYSDGEVGERLLGSSAPETVAAAVRQYAPHEPGVIFAPTVESAQAFAEAMRTEGFTCEAVWGAMPLDRDTVSPLGMTVQKSRRRILREFNLGKIDWLANCMVLTEGFDAPRATVAVIARATQSAGLYVQMVGRVLRLWSGKAKALVLDIVGATTQHELCTLAVLAGDEPKDTENKTLLDLYGTPCDLCGIPKDECLWNAEPPVYCCEQCTHKPVETGVERPVPVDISTTRTVETDLFAGSRQQWLQTDSGHWFISAGERFIALAPRPDGDYDVIWMRRYPATAADRARGVSNGGYLAREISSIEMAMARGEATITREEEILARKEGGWRKRRITEKQANRLRGMRAWRDEMASWKAGRASDEIARVEASHRLDPMINKRIRAAS